MPDLPLNTGAYARGYGLPPATLVNMIWEAAPTTTTRTACFQRPGLTLATTFGAGPIKGLFSSSGNFGGLMAVSGSTLYSSGLGLNWAVPGSAPTSVRATFAESIDQIVVVNNSKAYCVGFNGVSVTFAEITDSDLLPRVFDVAYLAGRFVYVGFDATTQEVNKFCWSALGDATAIDGLDFASADSSADPILRVIAVSDSLYFIGTRSVERWVSSPDGDAPFQRISGGGYERGCGAPHSVVKIDNSVMWVGDDLIVYRADSVPKRMSVDWVEEKIRSVASPSASVTACKIEIGGHKFYLLKIVGVGSYAYDLQTGEWSEWQSYGKTSFRGSCSAGFNGTTGVLRNANAIGDDANGTVWYLDPAETTDNSDPINRTVPAYLPMKGGRQRINNVMLQTVRGVGLIVDPGADPAVEERHSDDGGGSWTDWVAVPLGKIGEYTRKAIWWGQGTAQSPGRHYEFRCSADDPVNFVVTGATYNEPRP